MSESATSSVTVQPPESSFYQRRRISRLPAVQALYQFEQTSGRIDVQDTSVKKILDEISLFHSAETFTEEVWMDMDEKYVHQLVHGTVLDCKALDAMISACLVAGWRLNRLESVVRAILRVGAYELKAMLGITTAVLVNEYLDIAKAFFDGKEPAFVNGMMDSLARNLRAKKSQ